MNLAFPVLGQVDPEKAAAGFVNNPIGWSVIGLVFVVGFLFRAWHEETKAHLQTVKTNATEQREIIERIVPLTGKLTEAVESIDRITDRLVGKQNAP